MCVVCDVTVSYPVYQYELYLAHLTAIKCYKKIVAPQLLYNDTQYTLLINYGVQVFKNALDDKVIEYCMDLSAH